MKNALAWKQGDLDFSDNGKSSYKTGIGLSSQDIGFFVLEHLAKTNIKGKSELAAACYNAIDDLKSRQQQANLPEEQKVNNITNLRIFNKQGSFTDFYIFMSVSTGLSESTYLLDASDYSDLSHLITKDMMDEILNAN